MSSSSCSDTFSFSATARRDASSSARFQAVLMRQRNDSNNSNVLLASLELLKLLLQPKNVPIRTGTGRVRVHRTRLSFGQLPLACRKRSLGVVRSFLLTVRTCLRSANTGIAI